MSKGKPSLGRSSPAEGGGALRKHPYDPAQEKEQLSAAIGAVDKHWGTAQMAQAYKNLAQAIAHAEHAVTALEPRQDTRGHAFKVHVLGLGCMLQYARDELARVERCAPAVVDRKRAKHP